MDARFEVRKREIEQDAKLEKRSLAGSVRRLQQSGDDELGKSSWFRWELRYRDEQYCLAVPSDTNVRDLDNVPEYTGSGQVQRAERRVQSAECRVQSTKIKTLCALRSALCA